MRTRLSHPRAREALHRERARRGGGGGGGSGARRRGRGLLRCDERAGEHGGRPGDGVAPDRVAREDVRVPLAVV